MHYPITKETLNQRLAKRVRALRKKLGLTLNAAAVRAELHWRHWQNIEMAEVDVTLVTLVRVADTLDVEPDKLFDA